MDDKNKSLVDKAMGAAKSAPAPAKSEAKPEVKKAVMDKGAAGLGGSKKSKHGIRSTHIDHHTDGSATVKHQMAMRSDKVGMGDNDDDSYAVKNVDELVSRLKEKLGGSSEPAPAAAPPSSAAPAPAAPAVAMP